MALFLIDACNPAPGHRLLGDVVLGGCAARRDVEDVALEDEAVIGAVLNHNLAFSIGLRNELELGLAIGRSSLEQILAVRDEQLLALKVDLVICSDGVVGLTRLERLDLVDVFGDRVLLSSHKLRRLPLDLLVDKLRVELGDLELALCTRLELQREVVLDLLALVILRVGEEVTECLAVECFDLEVVGFLVTQVDVNLRAVNNLAVARDLLNIAFDLALDVDGKHTNEAAFAVLDVDDGSTTIFLQLKVILVRSDLPDLLPVGFTGGLLDVELLFIQQVIALHYLVAVVLMTLNLNVAGVVDVVLDNLRSTVRVLNYLEGEGVLNAVLIGEDDAGAALFNLRNDLPDLFAVDLDLLDFENVFALDDLEVAAAVLNEADRGVQDRTGDVVLRLLVLDRDDVLTLVALLIGDRHNHLAGGHAILRGDGQVALAIILNFDKLAALDLLPGLTLVVLQDLEAVALAAGVDVVEEVVHLHIDGLINVDRVVDGQTVNVLASLIIGDNDGDLVLAINTRARCNDQLTVLLAALDDDVLGALSDSEAPGAADALVQLNDLGLFFLGEAGELVVLVDLLDGLVDLLGVVLGVLVHRDSRRLTFDGLGDGGFASRNGSGRGDLWSLDLGNGLLLTRNGLCNSRVGNRRGNRLGLTLLRLGDDLRGRSDGLRLSNRGTVLGPHNLGGLRRVRLSGGDDLIRLGNRGNGRESRQRAGTRDRCRLLSHDRLGRRLARLSHRGDVLRHRGDLSEGLFRGLRDGGAEIVIWLRLPRQIQARLVNRDQALEGPFLALVHVPVVVLRNKNSDVLVRADLLLHVVELRLVRDQAVVDAIRRVLHARDAEAREVLELNQIAIVNELADAVQLTRVVTQQCLKVAVLRLDVFLQRGGRSLLPLLEVREHLLSQGDRSDADVLVDGIALTNTARLTGELAHLEPVRVVPRAINTPVDAPARSLIGGQHLHWLSPLRVPFCKLALLNLELAQRRLVEALVGLYDHLVCSRSLGDNNSGGTGSEDTGDKRGHNALL